MALPNLPKSLVYVISIYIKFESFIIFYLFRANTRHLSQILARPFVGNFGKFDKAICWKLWQLTFIADFGKRMSKAAQRMAAKLAERKAKAAAIPKPKAYPVSKICTPEEYEEELSDMIGELMTEPPIKTLKLRDVLAGSSGKYQLDISNGLASFIMFTCGASYVGYMRIPSTSSLPGPSVCGPCVFNSNTVVIFDMTSQRIATLAEPADTLICGITSLSCIGGICDLFISSPPNSVQLAAFKLIGGSLSDSPTERPLKLIICLTKPHRHCHDCAIFNAFEFDFSEFKLKQIGGQYPNKNYIKNVPVGRNLVTSICDLGYINNLWDKISCDHFPKGTNWGQLNHGKFADSYGRFVMLFAHPSQSLQSAQSSQSSQSLQSASIELYESGKPLFMFEAERAFFDDQGFIWFQNGETVTRAGITESRQLMIILQYINCATVKRRGNRIILTPKREGEGYLRPGITQEEFETAAVQNYENFQQMSCTF